jgi:uncharacterized protein (TIGR03083 family)
MAPPTPPTLAPERYLEVLRTDGARLAAAARAVDPAAAIPSCPGWVVADCVAHTGTVFRHKAVWLDIGRRPVAGEYEGEPPAGADLVEWYEASLAEVVDALERRDPAAPANSWWPPDQTVGFWYRRMAQEVAVHRVDVEDALGEPTPIPTDVAVDGIDEVLHAFLGEAWRALAREDWAGVDPEAGAGRTIVVRAGGHAWATTLGPDEVTTVRLGQGGSGEDGSGVGGGEAVAGGGQDGAGDGMGDAVVSGDPATVLLWLWGRRPDADVAVDGDREAVAAFRARLVLATQ